MSAIKKIGINAKNAKQDIKKLSSLEKDNLFFKLSKVVDDNRKEILRVNKIDIDNAINLDIKDSFIDRLTLNDDRLNGIMNSFLHMIDLKDPIGEISHMEKQKNGLTIGRRRTSLGVVGIIYESRPNVTADAFGLCLKTSNCVILRGGKEAINTNKMLVDLFRMVLKENNCNEDFVQLIEDTNREVAIEFMKLNEYIDVLIPRGGASLIKTVVQNSTIPVIETGVGNCHIFIDETCDFNMAKDIIINGKIQRPGVCNTLETLLISNSIKKDFTKIILNELINNNVEVRGCTETVKIAKENNISNIILATEEDYYTEFADMIIAVKIINNIDDAIYHIEKYGSHHSDAIVTQSYTNSNRFLDEVDSAVVYVNASTRFTDGVEFGLGAEIGISTQKLHVRGPMGLEALTTTKYIVLGNGETRN